MEQSGLYIAVLPQNDLDDGYKQCRPRSASRRSFEELSLFALNLSLPMPGNYTVIYSTTKEMRKFATFKLIKNRIY